MANKIVKSYSKIFQQLCHKYVYTNYTTSLLAQILTLEKGLPLLKLEHIYIVCINAKKSKQQQHTAQTNNMHSMQLLFWSVC
jgi:hypothetical protein